MKVFSLFLIMINIIGFIVPSRRHNTKESMTKIIEKIRPDPKLCNDETCPPERGTCSGENICYCFDGYISTFETKVLCDYEQKDRTLFFLLEFIVGLGLGHFYVGNKIYGGIKCGVYIIILGIYFVRYHTRKGIDAARMRLFLWLLIGIWQVVDGICIWTGKYKDGRGQETGYKYF